MLEPRLAHGARQGGRAAGRRGSESSSGIKVGGEMELLKGPKIRRFSTKEVRSEVCADTDRDEPSGLWLKKKDKTKDPKKKRHCNISPPSPQPDRC